MADERMPARAASAARRAPNSDASAYWRSVDAFRPATGALILLAGSDQAGGERGRKRQRRFMRERGDAEQAAAGAIMVLAVGIALLLRRGVAVRVRHAVGMDMDLGLRLMHVRCAVRLGQAMRRRMGQGERRMRRNHAERIERGQRERRS